MEKKERLESAYKFCILLNKEIIKKEIDSFLVGYFLDGIKLQNGGFECFFSDENNNTISLYIYPMKLHLSIYKDNLLSRISIGEDLILNQVDIEKRENGVIYREIIKYFEPSSRFKNEIVLVDLIEDSYAFFKDRINRIIDKEDFRSVSLSFILLKIKRASTDNELKNICDLHNRFSTHMNYYVQCQGGRIIKDNIYPTRTFLNGEEVSSVFDIIDGPDKLYRVYDLFRGIINPRNENDINSINLGLLSADVFDFRSLRGITGQENNLVGKDSSEVSVDYINYLSKLFNDKYGYNGEIRVDRDSLLKGITYQAFESELSKKQIDKNMDKMTKRGPKRLLKRIFKRRYI